MPKHLGLRHIALFCQDISASCDFYTKILNMEVEWQPDSENIYLTSGADNLALHQAKETKGKGQVLDHLGFIVETPQDVQSWHDFMTKQGISPLSPVKAHRDGAHSFYCEDPDGNSIQIIYHPPISHKI